MRGNQAIRLTAEDQTRESPMESRITAIETDLRNFKENVKENIARLFDGMKSMNDAIIKLLAGQEELRGDIKTLRAEMGTLRTELRAETGTLRAEMGTLRTELRAEMGTLRAEMGTLRAEMKAQLSSLETKMMRWFVATGLSCTGLAFAATRFFS